ncbi:MAG: LysM peptidoglycan-binding domain-containing protein [Archangiaceae bacterium]|nr:LysM peptidoglycan-binding domain-containing protein [Archangiaceae bacterium]
MASSYTIRPGDTLSALAARFNTTVAALVRANNIANPDLIYAGRKLTIPDGFTPSPGTPPTDITGGPPSAGSENGVPFYRQGDARWGGRILGDDSSIASAGCAMTATAMAISKISGKPINPGELDAYLDRHGGYDRDNLYWGVAAASRGLSASKATWSLSTIDSNLSAGKPVVIGVDYKNGVGTDHWITITNKETVNGRVRYAAHDPATGTKIYLYPHDGRLEVENNPVRDYKSCGQLVVFS